MSYQILGARFSIVEVPTALGKAAQQHLDEALVPGDCHGEEAFLQAEKKPDFHPPSSHGTSSQNATAAFRPPIRCNPHSPLRMLTKGCSLSRQVHAVSPFTCQLGAVFLPLPSHQAGRDVHCRPLHLAPHSIPRAEQQLLCTVPPSLLLTSWGSTSAMDFPCTASSSSSSSTSDSLPSFSLSEARGSRRKRRFQRLSLRQWHLASCTMLLSCFWAEATSEASKGKSGEV